MKKKLKSAIYFRFLFVRCAFQNKNNINGMKTNESHSNRKYFQMEANSEIALRNFERKRRRREKNETMTNVQRQHYSYSNWQKSSKGIIE